MNEQVQRELKKILNGRFSLSESTRANYARGEDSYEPVLSQAVAFPETNEEVSKILKLIRRSAVDHTYLEEEGDPVEKIIEKANDDKIIVMRASNMNPIKRYFKGSKPLSVMNKCNVPILIVK
mgnify:CR=1 FL=1